MGYYATGENTKQGGVRDAGARVRSTARRRDPDVLYDEDVQRALDERHEIAMACEAWFDDTAFRPTADELAEQDAFMAGQRAGHLGRSSVDNEWAPGSAEHFAWERGRSAVLGG